METSYVSELISYKSLFFLSNFIYIAVAFFLWRRYKDARIMREEFVNIISHKFRTPLSTIKWTLENLMPMINDSFHKKDLSDVYKMNTQLIHMTNTLLELTDKDKSSTKSYNFEKVSLSTVVAEEANSMKTEFSEKNIVFGLQPGENVFVWADKARLAFVVHVLLQNSLSYTRVAGRVDVVVGITENKATVTVRDNGIGIESGELHSIFRKFHRAKNATTIDTEGLGVGLFLAKSIARRLKGSLTVTSEGQDKGATSILVLPLAK